MTVEGAPHLSSEHYSIFDCASKQGKIGTRSIPYKAHIRMMAAVQPFISGSISKTVNMSKDATIADVQKAYDISHKSMLKANALYRDGSKLSQPLNATNDAEEEVFEELHTLAKEVEKSMDLEAKPKLLSTLARKKLPSRRSGFVQEAKVGGQKVYLKTGEYSDGALGEIFIDMYKEGASYKALLNCFAVSVSKGLQYGIPLSEYVDTFSFTRFEPAGPVTGHEAIKSSTSVIDYIFRVLGYEYLQRTDFVHVKPAESDSQTVQSKLVETKKIEVEKQTTDEKDSKTSLSNNKIKEAKAMGYTGETCTNCGSMKMKRNGSCMVCIDCGETTGCS